MGQSPHSSLPLILEIGTFQIRVFFLFDLKNFCLKMSEFWWNHNPHDFEDLWKFNSSLWNDALSRAWKVRSVHSKSKFEVLFQTLSSFYTPGKIFQFKKFPRLKAKSYYVPSLCFLKAKNWDIETLETALESSNSVLFNGLELKGLINGFDFTGIILILEV